MQLVTILNRLKISHLEGDAIATTHIANLKSTLQPAGLWALTLASILFLLIANTTAWAETLSLNDYRAHISQTINYLQSRQGAIKHEERVWMRKKFPPGLSVQYDHGGAIPVDRNGILSWIRKAEDSAQGRDRLIVHLQALLGQLTWQRRSPTSHTLSWNQCRNVLEHIYTRKEFRHLRETWNPPWQAFIRDFLATLGRWLSRILPSINKVPGDWIQYPVYALVLILCGLLVRWIFRSTGSGSWHWRQQSTIKPLPAPKTREKDWKAWREDARQKAKTGSFREAIRALFISVLLEGHQRGWWTYEKESTNREHLARVEGPLPRRAALQNLIVLYESTWYGLAQPDEEDYRAGEKWVGQMEAAV